MTPNGAIVFTLVVVLAAMMSRMSGLIVLYLLCTLFAVIEVGPNATAALRRAVILMVPLAAFMVLVWVGSSGARPRTSLPVNRDRASVRSSTSASCARDCF